MDATVFIILQRLYSTTAKIGECHLETEFSSLKRSIFGHMTDRERKYIDFKHYTLMYLPADHRTVIYLPHRPSTVQRNPDKSD